jgi:hypothetical protein
MTEIKIPRVLLRLIERWIDKKLTGSLQINFIKGEIVNVIKNLAVNIKNNGPINKFKAANLQN